MARFKLGTPFAETKCLLTVGITCLVLVLATSFHNLQDRTKEDLRRKRISDAKQVVLSVKTYTGVILSEAQAALHASTPEQYLTHQNIITQRRNNLRAEVATLSTILKSDENDQTLAKATAQLSKTWATSDDYLSKLLIKTKLTDSNINVLRHQLGQLDQDGSSFISAANTYQTNFLNSHKSRQINAEIAAIIAILTSAIFVVGPLFIRLTKRESQLNQSYLELSRLAQIAKRTVNSIIITDEHCKIIYVNESFYRLTDLKQEEAMGENPFDLLFSSKIDPTAQQQIEKSIQLLIPADITLPLSRNDGTQLWVKQTVEPRFDAQGKHSGFIIFQLDVTENRNKNIEIARARKMLAQSARLTNVGAWELDVTTGETRCSQQFRAIYGLSQNEEPTLDTILDKLLERDSRRFSRAIKNAQKGIGPTHLTYSIKGDGQKLKWITAIVEPNCEEGESNTVFLSIQDITQRKHLEDELYEAANTDSLTGLKNRRYFTKELQNRLNSRPYEQGGIAILVFNCERFKALNESLGPEFGDSLLKTIAERMQCKVAQHYAQCLDQSGAKAPIIARLAGDEFAILIFEEFGDLSATSIAEHYRAALSEPYIIADTLWKCEVRVGVSLYDGKATAQEFLKTASIAVNHARIQNGSQVCIFDDSLKQSTELKRRREHELQTAVDKDEFQIHYQPIINFNTQSVEGFESLIRWQHPQDGLLMPADFIEIAEESGLIVGITEWILKEATRQVAEWHRVLKSKAPIFVSVNISRRHLATSNFASSVLKILSEAKLNPSFLHLEVTESGLMANLSSSLASIAELRAAGVKISLDDFGTGLSSLSCIKDLPIDTIKIDRSFVHGLSKSRDSQALIKAVAQISDDLGIDTIAEGIEACHQLSMLASFNIARGQGYLFGKPLPAEEINHDLMNINFSIQQNIS
ncbi:EAL domain-containing protein [Kamptonema cortianum]|nr:EAL domain-containing protein [Geitlerinema splendidum]MDK3156239.1 EAL domain-containing protein [Kamptonema cortianum]